METVQTIEYLGLVMNSIQMTLSLTEEKVKGILQERKIIFSMKEITVLQLTQSPSIQAVLPAQIQFRYLQLQQVSTLKGGMSYKEKIILNDQALGELQWWMYRQMPHWKVGEPIAWVCRLRETVSRREEIAYKYPRIPSGEECHLSFHKRENNQCNSYPDRQHNCPLVPSKNGRYDRQDTCRFKQRHLEICDIEADHNCCIISPRYSEHKSSFCAS